MARTGNCTVHNEYEENVNLRQKIEVNDYVVVAINLASGK